MRRQAAVTHLPHAIALRVPPAVEQLVCLAHVAPVKGDPAQHRLPRRLQRGLRAWRLRRRGGEYLTCAAAFAAPSVAVSATLTGEVETVVANRLERAAELGVGIDRVDLVRARL